MQFSLQNRLYARLSPLSQVKTPHLHLKYFFHGHGRVAMIPEKLTPAPTLTPAKSGSELTPATPTPLKSCNLPYIVEPNLESDSDSFWEKSRLQATQTPGIIATLGHGRTHFPLRFLQRRFT